MSHTHGGTSSSGSHRRSGANEQLSQSRGSPSSGHGQENERHASIERSELIHLSVPSYTPLLSDSTDLATCAHLHRFVRVAFLLLLQFDIGQYQVWHIVQPEINMRKFKELLLIQQRLLAY